jgi:hypothetical protein
VKPEDQFKSACIQNLIRGFEEYDLDEQTICQLWCDALNETLDTTLELDFESEIDLGEDEE